MRAFCRFLSRLIVAVILVFVALSFPLALFAQASSGSSGSVALRPLITQPVDENQLTVLKGNTHRLARPEFDLGTAPATLPLQRMLLVLKRSGEQEAALRKLLDDQQDKASPSYHKWLTPEHFGQQFGPSDSDMQTITSWLQSHGFQVGSTKGRTLLEFSGSANRLNEAFHTSIHKYVVKGEQHWANAGDPSIPTALTPAVAGVLTLHNFVKKPHIHFSPQPVAAKISSVGPNRRPQVTFPAQNGQPTTYALGPQDYATIYNINPVYNSQSSNGSNNNGNESTIAVVGRSNLFGGGEDVQNFRSTVFGLCCGNYNIILDGPDPGNLGGGEEAEATLDTTWSGAVAPGATVDLVVSATTNTTDGIDLSELYIIENNFADIMTESFGACEYYATDSQVAGVNALAEQAAAQGITYFVSAGDDGAEGCDDQDSETVATGPLSVSLLASTPFTVAVGGTQFNENGDDSKYWTNTPPISETAISYIPENVWNQSCLSSGCGGAGIWAASGGISSGNTGNGGTFAGFPKPAWQSGFGDTHRDVPDVSLTAAGHDPYLLCLEGSCQPNSQGEIHIYLVSGTSASTPSFAGIMALVDQQMQNSNPNQGLRQGQADYVLYRLAMAQQADTILNGLCNASGTSTLPNSACVFNDVTVGNNAVPGEINYGLANANYQAGVGYDMASGLGSVNVANLVNQWNTATFNPTSTSLLLNSTTSISITHGQSVSVNISVSPNSGTGAPSGDVSLLAQTNVPPYGGNSVGFFTLSNMSAVLSSTNQLTGGGGGPYSVTAHYAGDATYAPSDSTEVIVTVAPESSSTTVSALTFDAKGNQSNFSGGPFGSFVYLRADVAGKSGVGIPTGSVSFLDQTSPIVGASSLALNSEGNTASPNGILTFDAGTHAISASYSGDTSFNPSTSSPPISFTIQAGFFAAVSSSQVMITAPGASGSTSVNVSSSTGFTGTIALACSGLPAGASCQFSPSSIKATATLATTSSTITVTTTAAAAKLSLSPQHVYFAHWMPELGLFFSVVLLGAPKGRRARGMFLCLMLCLLVSVPGCGGGSSNSTPPAPPPVVSTPAGSYNVFVTATSGSAMSSTGFALAVQ
jgi:subtilase family serine protease